MCEGTKSILFTQIKKPYLRYPTNYWNKNEDNEVKKKHYEHVWMSEN